MFKFSRALTSSGVKLYHERDHLDVSQQAYYSEKQRNVGEWYGKTAEFLGLHGGVIKEHFDRLADGQHPFTGEQLIKHRSYSEEVTKQRAEHRAAWDMTVAPPKSVSATALVAGDVRIRDWHRESLLKALDAGQEYIQARLSRGRVQTTGSMVAAMYEHDTSRPVDGKSAPQLHTHVVLMNMTNDNGKMRSLDPREMFRVQTYLTAVYRAELTKRLLAAGYEIERTKGNSFEIKGYTPEYLEALSQRAAVIREQMAESGLQGPKAAAMVAVSSREAKLDFTPEELIAQHLEQAAEFGDQPDHVRAAAELRVGQTVIPADAVKLADAGITHAKHRLTERTAVFDEYEILRDALHDGMGKVTLEDVQSRLAERTAKETEFVPVSHVRPYAPGHRYTTPEMIKLETEILTRVRESRESVSAITENVSLSEHPDLENNVPRQKVLEGVLKTKDQFVAIQGSAGSKKTTGLMILKPFIERAGYEMVSYAPTGAATNELAARGLKAETLQSLIASPPSPESKARFWVIDEMSLADAEQIGKFMEFVRPGYDHVLFVGDDSWKRTVSQHKAVGPGRIFHEMQMSGMRTAELNRMFRQKTDVTQVIAKHFRDGKTDDGLQVMDKNELIQEHESRPDRLRAVAKDYASSPERTFIASPDNLSRRELNLVTREEQKNAGHLRKDRFHGTVLLSRDIYKRDSLYARSYDVGNVIRFPKRNKEVGVKARDYATVTAVDSRKNELTVRKADGSEVTYNAAKVQGIQVYSAEKRAFAIGERIQFTDPLKDSAHKLANRDTGTIVKLDRHGNARIRLDKDNGRHVTLNLKRFQHTEYAYAMTSQSLQGKTIARTLFHADTSDPMVQRLLGRDIAYVLSTRGEFEFKIYTDSKEDLGNALARENGKATALSPMQIQAFRPVEQQIAV